MDELARRKYLSALRSMPAAELRQEAARVKEVRDNWFGFPCGGKMALEADSLYAECLRELGSRRLTLVA